MLGRVYEEAADAIASKELAESAVKGRSLAQKPLFLAKNEAKSGVYVY
jgi:hypothetical protein